LGGSRSAVKDIVKVWANPVSRTLSYLMAATALTKKAFTVFCVSTSLTISKASTCR
jgi:hypothetical protein